MARMGKVSAGDLKKLQQELNKIEQKDVESFISACAKELAARLLAKVIKRTPVGDYSKEITVVAKKDSKHHKAGDTYTKRVNPSGKMGGTLRRGWTSATHEEAASGTLNVELIAETAFIAGVASLGTSLAGLPEVKQEN